MDFATLAAERLLLGAITNGLLTIIHITRPTRREGYSGLSLSLKNSQGTHPEGDEQNHAPLPFHVAQDKKHRQDQARRESAYSHNESLAALFRPEVDQAHSWFTHDFSISTIIGYFALAIDAVTARFFPNEF